VTQRSICEANTFIVVKFRFNPFDIHLHAYNLFTSRLADFYILNDNGYILPKLHYDFKLRLVVLLRIISVPSYEVKLSYLLSTLCNLKYFYTNNFKCSGLSHLCLVQGEKAQFSGLNTATSCTSLVEPSCGC
jgi:hypothetical protein